MKRSLGASESALTQTDIFSPLNVVIFARLRRGPPPSLLRRGLDAVQAGHAVLNARIIRQKRTFFFEAREGPPIPLTIEERSSEDHWRSRVEAELNSRIDTEKGPLLRCRYLYSPVGPADLILTFHHAILDASSAEKILRDLLSWLRGDAVTEPVAECDVRSLPPPQDALFPRKYRGLPLRFRKARLIMKMIRAELSYRRDTRHQRAPAIAGRASCRILTRSLGEGPTAALVKAARHRRVTLHGLFNAAILLAVARRIYDADDLVLRGIYFSDLRPYLEPPVSESLLGCFDALLRLDMSIKPPDDIWSVAERFNARAHAVARSGDKFLFPLLSPGLMRALLRLRSRRLGATGLSYTGVLFSGYEDGDIEEFHAFASNNVLGPEFTSQVRLFRRRIWWDMVYLDSDMNAERAGDIAEEIIRILEAAAGRSHGTRPETSGGTDG